MVDLGDMGCCHLSCPASTCPVSVGLKPPGFPHHNQIFDVTIEKCDCDIKNLIMMPKAGWLFAHFNWTCGQENCYLTY